MITDLAILLIVQAALWAFYALCPWWTLGRWMGRESWPVRLALSVLAGTVSQAVLGVIWSALVRKPAIYEGILYLLFWLVTGAFAGRWKRGAESDGSGSRLTSLERSGLAAMLLAGLIARLLHPLRTWALGQSDAYSHLAMFRDIVTHGALQNAIYPPGYAWVMSMPAAVLQIDPYHVARFGGAFFGVALVLAVYFLLREGCRDRGVALAGAFLVAGFPGLGLLIKTGIGTFANQFGLFLLPIFFAGVLLAGRADRRRMGSWVLAVSFLGLLLSVPMLLLHAVMAVLLFQMISGWKRRTALPRWVPQALLALSLALGLAAAIVIRYGSRTLAATAVVLSTADEAVAANILQEPMEGLDAVGMLVRDYFSIKRWGIGNPLGNGALVALFGIFAALAVTGFRKGNSGRAFIGCWGGLVALQTATGFLQFTAYQREGWSLMIATGCLGGLATSWLWSRFRSLRPVIVVGMALAAALTFWRPPAHHLTNSTAEETMVRIARMFSSYPNLSPDRDPVVEEFRRFLLNHLVEGAQISLITRPLMQELMLISVAGPKNIISFSRRDIWRMYDLWMERSTQAIVLLDRSKALDVAQLGVFAGANPAGAQGFIQQQRRSYALNEDIEAHIRQLSTNKWRIASHDLTPYLRVYYVSKQDRSPGRESGK